VDQVSNYRKQKEPHSSGGRELRGKVFLFQEALKEAVAGSRVNKPLMVLKIAVSPRKINVGVRTTFIGIS
jgi:hypothetical protein